MFSMSFIPAYAFHSLLMAFHAFFPWRSGAFAIVAAVNYSGQLL
jgi:hypothetical protein